MGPFHNFSFVSFGNSYLYINVFLPSVTLVVATSVPASPNLSLTHCSFVSQSKASLEYSNSKVMEFLKRMRLFLVLSFTIEISLLQFQRVFPIIGVPLSVLNLAANMGDYWSQSKKAPGDLFFSYICNTIAFIQLVCSYYTYFNGFFMMLNGAGCGVPLLAIVIAKWKEMRLPRSTFW